MKAQTTDGLHEVHTTMTARATTVAQTTKSTKASKVAPKTAATATATKVVQKKQGSATLAKPQMPWWGDCPTLENQIPAMLQAGSHADVRALLRKHGNEEAPITQFYLGVVRPACPLSPSLCVAPPFLFSSHHFSQISPI